MLTPKDKYLTWRKPEKKDDKKLKTRKEKATEP